MPFLITIVCAFILCLPASSQLSVTAVSPAKNQVGASPAAPIVLTFSAALAPATVTPGSVVVFGKWSGPVPGTLIVGPTATTLTFQPSRPYFAAESVTFAVKNSVASTGGAPLANGFSAILGPAGAGQRHVLAAPDDRHPKPGRGHDRHLRHLRGRPRRRRLARHHGAERGRRTTSACS